MNINNCSFGNMIWVQLLVKQVILKIMTLKLKNKKCIYDNGRRMLTPINCPSQSFKIRMPFRKATLSKGCSSNTHPFFCS